MEEIDLKELLIFIKGKIGILITITASICILGCIYGLFIQKPMYKSDTTVILSGNESSGSITQTDITLNKNLVSTYAEIVKSRRVLSQVIDELNLKLTYEELSDMISVSSVNNTEIIKISVNNTSPVNAKNIANVTAYHFTNEVVELYNMNNVDILDAAIEAEKPYNINVFKQVIIYFMLGLVLSAGILFVIYYFDRTIKSVDQVEQKIKLPILGSVQEFNRGGSRK